MRKTYEVPEFEMTLILTNEDILGTSNDVDIETGGGIGGGMWGPQE